MLSYKIAVLRFSCFLLDLGNDYDDLPKPTDMKVYMFDTSFLFPVSCPSLHTLHFFKILYVHSTIFPFTTLRHTFFTYSYFHPNMVYTIIIIIWVTEQNHPILLRPTTSEFTESDLATIKVRSAFAQVKAVDNCVYVSNLTHTSSLFIYHRWLIVACFAYPVAGQVSNYHLPSVSF